LEAICDLDLYIWYIFFGQPGSMNDINVMNKSSIVGSILSEQFDTRCLPYQIHNHMFDWLYFLVDGIYPSWAIFCKTNLHPITAREKKYALHQEAVRKDIKRCFGVLVQHFKILQQPIHYWYLEDSVKILKCCVILHNMTVEVRRNFNTFTDLHHIIENNDADTGNNFPAVSLFLFQEENDFVKVAAQG